MPVRVSPDVQARFPGLCYGQRVLVGVSVQASTAALEEARRRLLTEWGSRSRNDLEEAPTVQAYRAFYRLLGRDPKRHRPPMENLVLRHALKGSLPGLSHVIDACNIASIRYLLPMAVFDLDRFTGDAVLRHSEQGELFQPIGRTEPDTIHGGQVVLADSKNVISIFSYRDSDLYKIRPSTENVLVVACRIDGIDAQHVAGAVAFASSLITAS